MARPPLQHRRKESKKPAEESAWLSPYLIGAFFGVFALTSVTFYHFFYAGSVVEDRTGVTQSAGSQIKTAVASFFGRTVFSQKPTTDLAKDEIDALGISPETQKQFEGAAPENYREKRRLYAMQKYAGARKIADERHRILSEEAAHRNTPAAAELKDAIESVQDSENLGLMKLESFVSTQINNKSYDRNSIDTVIFACQNLTEIYVRKNMKDKAKESYLNYLRLMKEKAPEDQGQGADQAISEVEKINVTATGN